MTIGDFLALCKKKLYLIIALPVIFGLVAAIIAWGFMTNDYTSTVSLYVLQHNSTDTLDSELSASDLTSSQQLSNDIAVLVKSNRVKNAVMDEMGIEDMDDYSLKISSNEKNRVINISCTGKNAKSVAQVVNCIARQTAALAVEIMNVDAVNIIEEAQPSTDPSGPNRMLIVLISALAGLGIAVAIIVLQDMLNTKVSNEDEIEELCDLPVLAQIPYIKKA